MSEVALASVLPEAVATARRWAALCRQRPEPRAARLLTDVLRDEDGLRFTIDFVDTVLRPEDRAVAAEALGVLARRPPTTLPLPLRLGLEKVVARCPRLLLPAVRRTFELLVGDLVVDVGSRLTPALRRLTARGADLNVNLLGEAVLGSAHAADRLDSTIRLLERPDVDYVSLKVSAVLGRHAAFGHGVARDDAVTALRPLMLRAAEAGKFVNFDMEEYRDLHLTLDVFEALAMHRELLGLHMGIAVQTYLRESPLVLERVDALAAARVARGGVPVKVRLVKGANLAMERVTAELHGWDLPVLASKELADASFLAALERCLTQERTARVRVGIASHNVYTLAAAWELAGARGVRDAVDIEMLAGMAVPLQGVVLSETGRLRLYVPVVERAQYNAAISYLVRRLEENAAPENFMSGAAGLGTDPAFLDREEERFRRAAAAALDPPSGWARQARPCPTRSFANARDTDPALVSNQAWATGIRERLPAGRMGAATVRKALLGTIGEVEALVGRSEEAGRRLAGTDPTTREGALHRLGAELEAARADLVTAAADETGKLIEEGDVEVSEACDFAHYYAMMAQRAVAGARQVPPSVTLIASPWNFPIAIPLGGIAAALAAGSAVILKPAPQARRTAALLIEACLRAGFSADQVALAVVDDGALGRALVTDRRVGQVVLTGGADTARLFRTWRPDLPLLAETSGKNAIIVTPSADLDHAAADLVASAFGHAGQKCSAASLGILVGSVARSRRFHRQLLDAASSLRPGWPDDPSATIGPVIEPPADKLNRGLTRLGPGERWLLEPRRVDDRLWSPGIRAGVQPGSDFHRVEFFGPVLGLLAAPDLDTAIAWSNGTDFGLTAGLHSLDRREVERWLASVEAGNLYVNRTITGAIVRRQPFGGWKLSSVGPTAKAGGPNYVAGFGHWEDDTTPPARRSEVTGPSLVRLVRAAGDLGGPRFADVVAQDEMVARSVFRAAHDPSALHSEINVLRYLPVEVGVRVEMRDSAPVMREASAALAAGSPATFSFRDPPERQLLAALTHAGLRVLLEDDESFDRSAHDRIRYLGRRAPTPSDINVTLYTGPTLTASRLALLPYLHEQSVCITAHRFGHPGPLTGMLSEA